MPPFGKTCAENAEKAVLEQQLSYAFRKLDQKQRGKKVKHESHSSLVPKPTRDSKCNFLLVLFSLLELLVELLRLLLVLYHRSKDI